MVRKQNFLNKDMFGFERYLALQYYKMTDLCRISPRRNVKQNTPTIK